MTNCAKRTGFTLPEFLIALLCVVILLGFFIPFFSRGGGAREHAKRMTCLNNLRNLAFAAISYESSHQEFPIGVGIEDRHGTNPVSGLVALLPFLEQGKLYDEISTPLVVGETKYPAFEASLADADYPPWAEESSLFVCPSAESDTSKFGRTSYAFSVGDVARNVSQQKVLRGAFGYFKALDSVNVHDGCSNTIGMLEIGGGAVRTVSGGCLVDGQSEWLDNPKQVFTVIDDGQYPSGSKLIDRGSHWADGRAGVALANTILPVNSPSFQVQGSSSDDGIYSAGSRHPGGCNVVFLDASTHFITDDIDVGDMTAATLTVEQMADNVPSPHGVWGALGTIGAGEDVTSWE